MTHNRTSQHRNQNVMTHNRTSHNMTSQHQNGTVRHIIGHHNIEIRT